MVSPEEKGQKVKGVEKAASGESDTQMKQNKMGLLCYAGFWVTGIIFLIIEKKNNMIRFHAMQSLVTFGILHIIWGVAGNFGSPLVWGVGYGWGLFSPMFIAGMVVFSVFFAIWWILWAVLMYRTYHGTTYRVPVFGNLAEKCLAKLDAER
ncbi:MAG: hypothetical protein PHQ43_12400 [Dehalococcoidales bacterium]|nr:hypothetical protein [Dehalococcoidales bacterium]